MMNIVKPSSMLAAELCMTAGMAVAADVPESDEPIKVILNDWTGQYVLAKIAGELLKKMGYTIEYFSARASRKRQEQLGLQLA